jgi:hypothetical protein
MIAPRNTEKALYKRAALKTAPDQKGTSKKTSYKKALMNAPYKKAPYKEASLFIIRCKSLAQNTLCSHWKNHWENV